MSSEEAEDQNLYFMIPDNVAFMTSLVGSIPSDWLHMNGKLEAPEDLVRSGGAVAKVGFSIDHCHRHTPTIATDRSYKVDKLSFDEEGLYSIIVGGKLPSYVDFRDVGHHDNGDLSLDFGKRVAAGFLDKGYRGHIFFTGAYGRGGISFSCDIMFQPWNGGSGLISAGRELLAQPARALLRWNELFGGEFGHVEPVVNFCREVGFREYVPQDVQKALIKSSVTS